MMTLGELKTLLEIPLSDTSRDDYLTVKLEGAVAYAHSWCRNQFLDEAGNLNLPPDVKEGIALKIKIDMSTPTGVQSESIGGMSQTFVNSNEKYAEVYEHWKPFKKVRFF